MAYNAKGQKKYNSNSVYLSVKYTPSEQIDGQRVKAYLTQTGQSANSYLKDLIKRDLDSKGFMLDGTGESVSESYNNSNGDSDIVEDNTETD